MSEHLGRLCDYAAERGVRVALQPHMDGALDTPDKVPGLVQALQAAGYDGDVCVEISLRVQRCLGFDPARAAIQSYEVLSAAFEAAGIARAPSAVR